MELGTGGEEVVQEPHERGTVHERMMRAADHVPAVGSVVPRHPPHPEHEPLLRIERPKGFLLHSRLPEGSRLPSTIRQLGSVYLLHVQPVEIRLADCLPMRYMDRCPPTAVAPNIWDAVESLGTATRSWR